MALTSSSNRFSDGSHAPLRQDPRFCYPASRERLVCQLHEDRFYDNWPGFWNISHAYHFGSVLVACKSTSCVGDVALHDQMEVLMPVQSR